MLDGGENTALRPEASPGDGFLGLPGCLWSPAETRLTQGGYISLQ